jgi:transketolase
MPGLIVLRPADANEVVDAWRLIMKLKHQPVSLILTRQPLPTFGERYAAPAVAKGGYVLADAKDGAPEVLLMASGSEVWLCLQAYEALAREKIRARVISMPSFELFEDQPEAYRDQVLPPDVEARVSVEQAATMGWDRYVGRRGHKIGMETFGASAPIAELQKKFGFTVENVVRAAKNQLER